MSTSGPNTGSGTTICFIQCACRYVCVCVCGVGGGGVGVGGGGGTTVTSIYNTQALANNSGSIYS